MATKKLSRTVVEGGRRGRWGERYLDRRHKREIGRKLRQGDEDPVESPAPWVTSDFSDKLKPLYRYLQANAGRPWDKVYSELCARYDRRTLKGWHLLSGHVDRYTVEGHGRGWAHLFRDGAWVDRHGILRYTQHKRWGRTTK